MVAKALDGLNPKTIAEFQTAYFDLVFRECERTAADMALLEREGLMVSRELTDDDDFFGIDSLEPGDICYEFTRTGQALCDRVAKEYVDEIPKWGDPEGD